MEVVILNDTEHVNKRKEMWMGSFEVSEYEEFVLNTDNTKFVKQNVKYCPALVGLFNEVIGNVYDNIFRNNDMKNVRVTFDKDKKLTTVYNDGCNILLEKFNGKGSDKLKEELYVPEVIFSEYRSSSNYDDGKKRISCGLHGYGVKLCNSFSKLFRITINNSGRQYIQEWSNKMTKKSKPIIKTSNNMNNDITVEFIPDDDTFGDDIFDYEIKIIKKYYDIIANSRITNKNINFTYNDQKINVKNFKDYIKMYSQNDQKIYYNKIHDKLEIGVIESNEDNCENIAFVNSIRTRGKFIDKIMNRICKEYINSLSPKIKKLNLNLRNINIKQYLVLFINALAYDVKFDGQSKNEIAIDINKNGCSTHIDDEIIKKIVSTIDICEKIEKMIELKLLSEKQKKDKKSIRSKIKIAKCDDAFKAGTEESYKCNLIVTEGDSAKTLADAGISHLKEGREYYGSYPLKGKLLNTRSANEEELENNKEIVDLKRILGLIDGINYSMEENFKQLRYGSIIMMSDSDQDGIHIKGLIINFIHNGWPELLMRDGFLKCFITPIVICKKGNEIKRFYLKKDYLDWKNNNSINDYEITYCKGLATLEKEDAEFYFEHKDSHIKSYYNDVSKEELKLYIELGFSDELSDSRKYWLTTYDENKIVDYKSNRISYSNFIDKELIHFSKYSVDRSIPNIMDGLKISQRKILYSCFKKKLTKKIRVSQLAGYVSEKSLYHHGESSLQMAIYNMGFNFVGSNNINLLETIGAGGTREGSSKGFGKNYGQPRYVNVKLNPITRHIFLEIDDDLLDYIIDDGYYVEPKYYVPIVPMCLINGVSGIGTGWNTNIPKYNIKDIVDIMNYIITYKKYPDDDPTPWYKDWTGIIEKEIKNDVVHYYSIGKWEYLNNSNKIIRVTEIPVSTTIYSYKEYLNTLYENGIIDDYKNNTKTNKLVDKIDFIVVLSEPLDSDKIVSTLGLKSSIPFNLVLNDKDGKIKVYKKINHIIAYFVMERLEFYNKRKKLIIDDLNKKLKIFNNKYRFLQNIIDNKLIIYRKPKNEIDEILEKNNYDKISINDKKESFDYLTSMKINSFSKDDLLKLEKKIEEIEKSIKIYSRYKSTDFYKEDINNLIKHIN